MATGSEWATVLSTAVAAVPVIVVIATAVLLTVGGIIGCAKCVLGAMGSRREDRAAETARVTRGQLAH